MFQPFSCQVRLDKILLQVTPSTPMISNLLWNISHRLLAPSIVGQPSRAATLPYSGPRSG